MCAGGWAGLVGLGHDVTISKRCAVVGLAGFGAVQWLVLCESNWYCFRFWGAGGLFLHIGES